MTTKEKTRFKTQVEFNGRVHESYRDAVTVAGAAREASKAWYTSGVTIAPNGEGKDLTGPYHRFLLTYGQSYATCRVYA